MSDFMTAQEIADTAKRLGLSCVPHSKRSVNRLADKSGWSENSTLCQRRAGVGGGMEYHISLLPDLMQASLIAEVSKAVTTRNTSERREVEVAKREALDTTALTARQRQVMNARSQVLSAIENMQITEGHTRSHAVKTFLKSPLEFGVGHDALIIAGERGIQGKYPGYSTVLRWFQYREQNGIGALAPKLKKERADIPSWFWDFFKHYARPQKPCITEALDAFLRSPHGVNEPISYAKVRRLIDKLGNVEKHRGREGSLTLKSRMAYVTRSTGDLLPTCVYTSDGKTFDAEIAHPLHGRPFRPEVTSVVDVATRKCVGFSVGLAENAEGVVDALRHSCEEHGVPAIFYVDRGSGFKNHRLDAQMTGLMGRLGITKYHSLPQNSQARGIIERFHGSVWNPLSREYDTYVNSEMDRQARQKSFKITRKEMREFGSSSSLPSWEEFLKACHEAVDNYNSKSHSALPNRMSPNEYWDQHVANGFEPVTVTKAESDDLFRPYVRRKVRRCQIEFKTNTYFHQGLQEYDGDEVLMGYDIHDANHVWVRAIDQLDGEDTPGRLICIAKFAGNEVRYVPQSMERIAMEKRAKARENRAMERVLEAREEANPKVALEMRAQEAMPSFTSSPERDFIEAEFVRIDDSASEPDAPIERPAPAIATDRDLALLAISHPEKLFPNQWEVLCEVVNDTMERQLLIDQGVDMEALIEAIRNAS